MPVPEKATVQAALIVALFMEAQQIGLDLPALVQRAGFDPAQVSDPDARFPSVIYLRVWQAMREQAKDAAFALRLGELVDPHQMGILGSVVMSSSTLRQVGQQFTRYARLLNSLYRVSQSEQDGRYVYVYSVASPPELEPDFVETHLAAAITLCRRLSQTDLVPLEMRFRYPAPDDLSHYRRIFRAPLRFEQPDNAMVMDASVLDLPVVQHDRYAHDLLSRHAAMLMADLEREDSLLGTVQRYILDSLASGKVSIDHCAEALCMSRRTLHRRLSAEGTSFQAQHEALRRQLALEYLTRPEIPLTEIAFLLGYSEVSAFHRAFRRWSGITPMAYREQEAGCISAIATYTNCRNNSDVVR